MVNDFAPSNNSSSGNEDDQDIHNNQYYICLQANAERARRRLRLKQRPDLSLKGKADCTSVQDDVVADEQAAQLFCQSSTSAHNMKANINTRKSISAAGCMNYDKDSSLPVEVAQEYSAYGLGDSDDKSSSSSSENSMSYCDIMNISDQYVFQVGRRRAEAAME
eukprot:Nk52_evm1s2385 gene=Nk52_evmTU1s2385